MGFLETKKEMKENTFIPTKQASQESCVEEKPVDAPAAICANSPHCCHPHPAVKSFAQQPSFPCCY
jgi:hypothetical protein